MNVRQLSNQLGTLLKLRPLPHRVNENGVRLAPVDHDWRLESIEDGPARVRLSNINIGHFIDLQSDNIQEYRSPNFLMLRCQLTIRPQTIEIEPIHKGAPIRPEPKPLSTLIKTVRESPILMRSSVWESFRGVLVRCSGRLGSLPEESSRSHPKPANATHLVHGIDRSCQLATMQSN